jgi:hypothetical protein
MSDLARHSSIMITMDLYGHIMPEVRQRESERLDETVLGTEKKCWYKLGTSK